MKTKQSKSYYWKESFLTEPEFGSYVQNKLDNLSLS